MLPGIAFVHFAAIQYSTQAFYLM